MLYFYLLFAHIYSYLEKFLGMICLQNVRKFWVNICGELELILFIFFAQNAFCQLISFSFFLFFLRILITYQNNTSFS